MNVQIVSPAARVFAYLAEGGAPMNETALCSSHDTESARSYVLAYARDAEDAPDVLVWSEVVAPEANDTVCVECRLEQYPQVVRGRGPGTLGWTEDERGVFANGYDSDHMARVLSRIHDVHLVCVWGHRDENGDLHGDSEIVGTTNAGAPRTWRRLSEAAWEFLSNPASTVAVPTTSDLLASDGPHAEYELDVDELHATGLSHNAAVHAA